jgi:hypothetical protein
VILAQLLFGSVEDRIDSPSTAIALFYLPIYGGIALTCVLASRRYGSGSLVQDFGWRFRSEDMWLGPGVFVVGVFSAAITGAIVTVALGQQDVARRTNDLLNRGYDRLPALAIVELAIVSVVLAPVLEELAFRGVLQRAFTARFGVGIAIALQAVCFGAYHFTPELGLGNISFTISRAVFGVVAGLAAMRWRHLGVGMVAHALTNAVFVILVVAAR